jgi:hypothetical protein
MVLRLLILEYSKKSANHTRYLVSGIPFVSMDSSLSENTILELFSFLTN